MEVPSLVSYDALLDSIHAKLAACNIGSDTEYLADLIITLESRSQHTHALAARQKGLPQEVCTVET
ncbi:MAG: hypothetical protein K2X93_17515 [Candidatus Obscuribacterales bacterium]|nr:hypothetical protein [Candidatus Obscuribacterales bacterium]